MTWLFPVTGDIHPTDDSFSFRYLLETQRGLPFGNHPGAFGFVRKNHIHEGVDIYGKENETVYAVEPGIVVAIENFTGEFANPPSPWWNNTHAVLVEGLSGVVVYGEIVINELLQVGSTVTEHTAIGYLKPVLKKDKGRPMTMLHLELHEEGTRQTFEWLNEKPKSLLDPTEFLRYAKSR